MANASLSPHWHQRFLALAQLVSTWSRDPSTKCGAVIVRPDKTIASIGYNGFPRGCDDDPKLYMDRKVKYARIIHAEQNALLNAREVLQGCTSYVNPLPPCDRCAAHLIQAGIEQVVYQKIILPEQWEKPIATAKQLFAEAGVELVELDNK